MKKFILISSILCIGAISSHARSLSVKTTDNVTYLFRDSDMGTALFSDASSVSIKNKNFSVPEILEINVVPDDIADNTVKIDYTQNSAHVTIAGNVASFVNVSLQGASVHISQSELVSDNSCGEISYLLSGSSQNGAFILEGSYKASIFLNNLSLTNLAGAPLDIKNGKRIKIHLQDGSENSLADGPGGEHKGTIACKGHLEFGGNGSLQVSGYSAHAIFAKEYIEVKNCSISVDHAAKDAINCAQYFALKSGSLSLNGMDDDGIQVDFKDTDNRESIDSGSITISGGTLNIATAADGSWNSEKSKTSAPAALKAEGDVIVNGSATISLSASGAGGKGIKCDGSCSLSAGKLAISTSGGMLAYTNNRLYVNYTGSTDRISSNYKSSPKGIKAASGVIIDGADISVTTSGNGGEGIESKSQLTIESGKIQVFAYDDCINSASHMNINGGDILVVSSSNDGLDSNGNMYFNGGYVRAFGASAPECGIDANEEGGFSVFFNSGVILGVGGGNSTPSSSSSSQPFVSGNIAVSAGDTLSLSIGNQTLAEFAIPNEYKASASGNGFGAPGGFGGSGGFGGPGGFGGSSSGTVLISCPGLASGSSYTLTNGSASSTVSAALTGSNSGRRPLPPPFPHFPF